MGGAGNIPWSKAMDYADDAGVTSSDDRERFWRMIAALDEVYLEWLAEKQSKPEPAKP